MRHAVEGEAYFAREIYCRLTQMEVERISVEPWAGASTPNFAGELFGSFAPYWSDPLLFFDQPTHFDRIRTWTELS